MNAHLLELWEREGRVMFHFDEKVKRGGIDRTIAVEIKRAFLDPRNYDGKSVNVNLWDIWVSALGSDEAAIKYFEGQTE